MSYSVEAVFKATGISKFTESFKNASDAVNDFTSRNEKSFGAFKQVGKMATVAGTAITAGLGFAVSKAADFEASMSKVEAISGATGEEMEQLSDKAREMGKDTVFSASEAADSMSFMSLAGWDAQQTMEGIGPTLDLAAASGMELARTADIVTDVMSMYAMEAEEAGRMTDVMAAASSSTNTDVDQLGNAFQYVGANAHAAGMDIEQTSAFLGVLADNGIKGSKAGTTLNAMLRDLKDGAEDGKLAVGNQTVALYDSEGQMRDMTDVMDDLIIATEDMSDEQRDQAISSIMGEQALKGFNVYANEGAGVIGELEDKLRDSKGAAGDMADTMQDNLKGSLTQLNSAFEEIMISLGEALLPAVKAATSALQGLANWFNNLSDGTKSFIAISAAVVGAFLAIAGPIMWLVGLIPAFVSGVAAIGTVIGLLMSPITLVVAAIIAAAALIYVYWEPIKEFFMNLWGSIKEITISVWESLVEVWNTSVEWLKETWNGVSEWFLELWNSIKEVFVTVWDGLVEEWNAFIEMMQTVFEPIIEFFSTVWESVSEVFVNAWEVISDTLSTVWESIQTAASAAWELIKNAILGPILLLINLVTGDMEAFKTNLSSIWENIKNAASKIWESLKTALTAIVKGLVDYIKTGWEGLKNVTSTVFSALSNLASSIWEGLKNAISGIVDGISSTVSSVWEGIKSTVTDLAEGAKQGAIDAWETLKDKTSEAFNKVVDFIKDPLGDIDLFSMGKDIIQGLIDGIGSMASAVWDKAKGIANGIGDSIKGALGIASPSKLMKEFGVFTGQGLEVGMQSMIRDINRASEDMAMAALPEVDTVDLTYESRNLKNNHIQPRTVNGSSGVTQNITINSPDATSPYENARKMKQASRELAMEFR